jgi:hypothetical protein
MSSPEPDKKPTVPRWATEDFHQFLDHQEDLATILHLSMNGISMLRGRPHAIKVLAEVDGRVQEEEENLKRASKERDLAQREVDSDFPVLHEQAIVALWSALEALVRSFAAAWLANWPGAWQKDAVKKLRVRLGEYEALDPPDRCLWAVDLLDQETSGPLKAGLGRFEGLLETFQLNGPVAEECRKRLFELSQVRHVVVHRRGKADRKLVNACPWLQLKPGDQIKISHEMWRQYNGAVGEYVLELIQRVRVAFGLTRYEPEETDSAADPTGKV